MKQFHRMEARGADVKNYSSNLLGYLQ